MSIDSLEPPKIPKRRGEIRDTKKLRVRRAWELRGVVSERKEARKKYGVSLSVAAKYAYISRLLLLGRSHRFIARKVGYRTYMTIANLKQSSAFIKVFRDVQSMMFEEVDNKMKSLFSTAISSLERLLNSKDEYIVKDAVQMVMRMYGQFQDKLILENSSGEMKKKVITMTPEAMQAGREFLKLTRDDKTIDV